MLSIHPEGPADGPQIEALLDRAFGSDRRGKVSYRYRDGVAPLDELCLVARVAGVLVGAIRYWPISLEGRPALLLGPLAIEHVKRSQGIGRALTEASLARAEAAGWRLVFLVGDPDYYARYGFAVAPDNIVMPGESPARLQFRTLAGAVLPAQGGTLRPAALPAGVKPGEERLAEEGHPFVAGHAGLHLPDPRGHGTGDGGFGGHLVETADQGADGEDDGPAVRQPAQGLALDPQPELLPGVLGREVKEGLARLRME
jgi:predicted N-acetyltransferase YhbS